MSGAPPDAAVSDPDARCDQDGLRARVARALAADGPLAEVIGGFRRRRSQGELAEAVCTAIESRGTLVAEAGTGVGKSLAYLIPALASGCKVMVSTGTKTLQDQLFDKDLALARHATRSDARVALLKGRANYVCWYHLERNLADGRFGSAEVPLRLGQIRRFAQHDRSGDRASCTEVPEDHDAWAFASSTRENCLGQD
ncbi:MAG: ATP-dependent DNA helicase, partial [Burkholderiales bacterium]